MGITQSSLERLRSTLNAGSDDGNGTVSATIGIPTLVWKGAAGATWETADAWTSGGNDYTFTANDKVAFTDGQSVALGSEVSVASPPHGQ